MFLETARAVTVKKEGAANSLLDAAVAGPSSASQGQLHCPHCRHDLVPYLFEGTENIHRIHQVSNIYIYVVKLIQKI